MSDQDRIKSILAEYQQAIDAAAQAAAEAAQLAAAESKQRELLDAHPDLADDLQKHFSETRPADVAATVSIAVPGADTATAAISVHDSLPLSALERIDERCCAFARDWKDGKAPRLEEYLSQAKGEEREQLLTDLLRQEIAFHRQAGTTPDQAGYLLRFPDDTTVVAKAFELEAQTEESSEAALDETLPLGQLRQRGAKPKVFFGNYELLDEVAKGGMGVVYKARQQGLDRIVALKMIRSGELAHEEEVERFYTEARAAAKLEHSGILPVHEIGECDGQHFFTMAFIEGGSLQDRLREGPLPPRKAAELVQLTAEAMQHAHENGIVHRDLKPANILLDRDGQPKVADFGLAKRLEEDSGLTASGTAMGTPSYMPPEQALGKGDEIGPLADVYSLGAVLYCLLTGRPPFAADNYLETIKQVIEQDPVPPRALNAAIPKDLETICLKCLRKEQRSRYQSAADFAADLGRWLDSKPIVARRVSRFEKGWLWCKRRPVVASLVALVLLIVGIGSGVFIERQNATHAQGLVDSLVKADSQQVTTLIDQIEEYQWWTKPLLQRRFEAAPDGSTEKLHLRLALLRFDDVQVEPLYEELVKCDFKNLGMIRDALGRHKGALLEKLWTIFHDGDDSAWRFRAGLTLATFAPDGDEWTGDDFRFFVGELVAAFPEVQPLLREYLSGIGGQLLLELERVFRDAKAGERRQMSAASALADFARDDIQRIALLAAEATADQKCVPTGSLIPAVERGEARRRQSGDRAQARRQHVNSPPNSDGAFGFGSHDSWWAMPPHR